MKDIEYKVRKINLSLPVAIEKIKSWCAYQERSHFETRNKLFEYGLNASDCDEAICILISENFLNEERFAESYARGKFRIKHWGKNKIKSELKYRKISDYSINKALKKIDADEYYDVLYKLVNKKLKESKEKTDYKKKYRVLQYAMSRGFEANLTNEILKLDLE